MRFYTVPEHPLRVYLEDDFPNLNAFITSLDSKYSLPEEVYSGSTFSETEVTSLIFYDEEMKAYYFPYGIRPVIQREAEDLGLIVHDDTDISFVKNEPPEIDKDLLVGISLRNYQIEGIISSLVYERGIVQVHTGGGKTEMMIGICRYLLDTTDMNILLCVPTTNLLYQTHDRMIKRGIEESEISLLGDKNTLDPTCRVLIATVQSAFKKLDVDVDYMTWLAGVQCLMMDEAHHSKCYTWSTVIDRISPRYLLGFSAEPFHRDDRHLISDLVLRGLLGPVIHRVTSDYLVEQGYLARPYVIALDSKCASDIYQLMDWKIVNRLGIVQNTVRNSLICQVAALLVNRGKKPLILVQQIAHGQSLAETLSKSGYNVTMMTGGLSVSIYRHGTCIEKYTDNDNQLSRDFQEGKVDVLIGTSALDEGADIPALSAVILAGGGKSRLSNLQRVGRSLRPKSGDNTAAIIDFRDRFNVITHSHHKKRKAMFDELGMPVYYVTSLNEVDQVINNYTSFSKVT